MTTDSGVYATRLAGTFAAEMKGLALTDQVIQDKGREIFETYLDHKVLVFRAQDITPSTFARFGTIFGRPEEHHVVKLRHPEEPTLTFLSNQNEPGRNKEMKTSGQGWHSDYSYKLVPGSATMLHGLEIPESGGDTLFADAEAAFAALPEERKAHLRTLRVRHQYRWSPDREDPWARWKYIGPEERRQTPEITHPLVRRHPDTGRETLFLQPRVIGSVIAIDGMPEAESTALIEELIAHITSEPFVYRHRWSPLDVVVWDNRCVLHSATTKDLDERHVRRLLRLTTHGQPVTPSDPETGHSRLSPTSGD
ncbi:MULTISPECIES: TauD/TfdA dioxygenase family protein [unclassified Streptomyces]|uniref:TauD/TfdA dioxygenase family protein n=1 Tax=unclassified Streptomyces TaxID=2593676 RepID=UPI002E2B1749|nr:MULTISPECIES: TauD/TfdA family dioxygenase [unclassified Streptomyces]WUB87091.1 TauD/TfdA family dioxygenase [Streptomyces sp. NBC_00566]